MKQIQFFFLFCLFAGNALSQSSTEFTHSVKSQVLGAVPAKDFWVAIPMIYNTGDSGKYAEITIASQSATTVHIRGSKIAPVDKKIKPMEQFVYKVETQDSLKHMEMRTSAVVEDKGIGGIRVRFISIRVCTVCADQLVLVTQERTWKSSSVSVSAASAR